MDNNIKEKSISGFKWSAIEKFSQQGIQFIIGIIIARILSPEDYGLVGILTIFIVIGQSFVDCGFGNALIRKIDRTQKDCSTVFYFNIVIGLLIYLLLIIVSYYIGVFFDEPILSPLLKVFAISILFNSLIVVQQARLTANIDFKTQAIASLISSLLSGGLGIYLAYNGYEVWSLVYQTISYSFIRMTAIWYMTKWLPSWTFSYESFKKMFTYGSKLLVSGLLNTIYREFTTIVIGKYYSAKDLGFYTQGRQIATVPSSNFTGILQRVTFPILAQYQNDDERLIQVYRKYIRYTSIVIFWGLFYLLAISKPLIITLLTSKWSCSIIYLQIFCATYLFDHISQINLNLLQVKGRSDLYLRLEIVKKLISLSLLFFFLRYSVIWICISQLIYSQIALFINTYYTGKLFSFTYIEQIKDFSKYFLAALFACLPAFIMAYLPLNKFIQILAGLIVSITLYYILLRKDIYMRDLLQMLYSKLKRRTK